MNEQPHTEATLEAHLPTHARTSLLNYPHLGCPKPSGTLRLLSCCPDKFFRALWSPLRKVSLRGTHQTLALGYLIRTTQASSVFHPTLEGVDVKVFFLCESYVTKIRQTRDKNPQNMHDSSQAVDRCSQHQSAR